MTDRPLQPEQPPDAGQLTDPARHGRFESLALPGESGNGKTPAQQPGETLAQSRAKGDDAFDVLLRRMHQNSDFPAMSRAVARIQGMAASDTESMAELTNEILKDVALANKLLRMVNAAFYARGQRIATVSRAVALVGFNAIRNMALGLVLIEGMQDKDHAELLTEEFLRSLMAASVARELCPLARDGEECFIGALFQDMGRLLAMYYFAQEAVQVRALLQADPGELSERSASLQVLGVSFEALGLGIARHWDLPDEIRRYMHQPSTKPPGSACAMPERLRWITVAANQIAQTMLRHEPREQNGRLQSVFEQFAPALASSPDAMALATAQARGKLLELASAMELRRIPAGLAARTALPADASEASATDTLHAALEPTAPGLAGPSADRLGLVDMLAAGISDITHALVEESSLSDVLRMVLETMYRAMGFSHVVLSLRDPKTDALTGRFGLGTGVDPIVRAFRVPLGSGAADLFHAVCIKGADTMIGDATTPRMRSRLPAWYLALDPAPAFLLLPLMIKDKPVGLIYADTANAGSLKLNERELGLLRTLRNQAVMAFKQSR